MEESDILCTIVLLKALAKTGGGHSIRKPLEVQLSPFDEDAGWRRAAIRFLDNALRRKQQQERFTLRDSHGIETVRKAEDKYVELNERFDYEDAHGRP